MPSRWIALIATVAPGASAAKRRDDHRPGRREGDGGVERLGRRVVVAAHPGGAQLARELVLRRRAREDADLAAPVAGDLDREVGRRPEAEEAEAAARLDAAEPQRPVADDAGAQERRRLDVARCRRAGRRRSRAGPRPARRSRRRPSTRGSRPARTGSRGRRGTRGTGRRRRPATPGPPARRFPRSARRPDGPGSRGRFRISMSPETIWRSVRHTPHAATSTITSPGPATGSSTSRSARSFGAVRTIAFTRASYGARSVRFTRVPGTGARRRRQAITRRRTATIG